MGDIFVQLKLYCFFVYSGEQQRGWGWWVRDPESIFWQADGDCNRESKSVCVENTALQPWRVCLSNVELLLSDGNMDLPIDENARVSLPLSYRAPVSVAGKWFERSCSPLCSSSWKTTPTASSGRREPKVTVCVKQRFSMCQHLCCVIEISPCTVLSCWMRSDC